MKFLPLIWCGIWRKPVRTLLIFSQISLAFALFGVLQGLKSGVDYAITKMRADVLVVHARESIGEPLPLAYLKRIEAVPGVKSVMIQNFLVGTYQTPTQPILALAANPNPAWSTVSSLKMQTSALEAMTHNRIGAMVSIALVRKYGWKIGDYIPIKTALLQQTGSSDWTFEVVGTFEDKESGGLNEAIIINNDYLNMARAEGKDTVQRYSLIIDDPKRAVELAHTIDDLFANSPDETRTDSLQELAQSQIQSIGDVNFVVMSIVSSAFFTLLFTVGVMMMQSIKERSPELATLKALGFCNRQIFSIILLESLALCIGAALLGLSGAALTFPLVAKLIGEVSMPSAVVAAGVGFAFVLAAICAARPAWHGRRMQVARALVGR
jgi:putative ABC transport system permease protein